MKKYRVGMIGSGNISGNYLRHARDVFADYYEIVAIGDLSAERAKAKAEEYGIPKYGLPEVVYNDPEIDIILNLTVPMAHEEVNCRALEAGKHVYSEKPLACTREGIERVLEVAKRCGKRVGCAPDSFLSAPAQTAKKALEEDWIGAPVGVSCMCAMRGNEFWRPDSDFFYKKGAGPMFDMAAYYFNILVSMFGSVESVTCLQKMTFPERTIKVAPRRGEKIEVEVPTYVTTGLKFKSGVIGSFTNSFDIWHTKVPHIEIHGEKGTMILPDPNRYKGDVLVRRFKDEDWRVLPQFVEYGAYGRGIGIVDMIRCIEADKPHKASAELARHVTDVILSVNEAAEAGCELKINTVAPQPEGLWLMPEPMLWR